MLFLGSDELSRREWAFYTKTGANTGTTATDHATVEYDLTKPRRVPTVNQHPSAARDLSRIVVLGVAVAASVEKAGA
jgi:hypothetical protein